MTATRGEPRLLVRVDSGGDGTWRVECLGCGEVLGRKDATAQHQTVESIVAGHDCRRADEPRR